MVSGTVHSLAHKQLALAFDFAGEQEVKNSEDRVPSYRVRMAGRNLPDPADPSAGSDAAQAAPSDARFAEGGQLTSTASGPGSSASRSACASRSG